MPDYIPDPDAEPGCRARRGRRYRDRREVSRAEVIEVLRDGGPVCVCAHASPDGDALGSLIGLGRSLAATGRNVVLYQNGDDPFPRELAFLRARRDQAARAGRCVAPHADRARLRLGAPHRPRRRGRGPVRAGRQHRPPPRQHALRHVQPRRCRGILHRGDRRRAARRGGHPAGRGRRPRALRGTRHRHGALPVRQHHAARAPACGAVAGGGRPARPCVLHAVRVAAARAAAPARPGARPCAGRAAAGAWR